MPGPLPDHPLRRSAGRVSVDESGPEPVLRLAPWRGGPLTEEQTSRALGLGFLSTAVTAALSYVAGQLVITTLAALLMGPAGGAYAVDRRRRRLRVTAIAARGETLVLFTAKGEREHIPMADVDQLGVGADGRELRTVWIQRGPDRACLFRDLTTAEAHLAVDVIERWLRVPKEPYR